jgi:hypothetical protein
MRLIGLQVSEIYEAPASAEAAATSASKATSAAPAAASTASTTTTATTTASSATTASARAPGGSAEATVGIHLRVLANLFHVDPGKGAGCPSLAGDGNRLAGEVSVAGEGRQRGSGGASIIASFCGSC